MFLVDRDALAAQTVKKFKNHLGDNFDIERATGGKEDKHRNDGIILTSKENKIFNPSTFVDKTPIELVGKIFRLDIETRTGRLRILEQDTAEGQRMA